MKITQHTPGPWKTAGQAIYARDVYVAQCWAEFTRELPEYQGAIGEARVPENDLEAEANARLIAAAPELLSALENFQYISSAMAANREISLGTIKNCAEQARAAIANARGTP